MANGLVCADMQTLKQRYRQYAVEPAGVLHGSAAPRLPVEMMLGFGAVSGLIAQTLTYPLDVVRRRMQVRSVALLSIVCRAAHADRLIH